MALVMLPSDLPWWSTVHRKLSTIQKAEDLDGILENMLNIHDLCNVSLDPDDDKRDSTVFDGFKKFIENDCKNDEREQIIMKTIKNISKRAQNLKLLRPPRGLNFSLQQQGDSVELNRNFVAALLANAFFSTFPKRTEKTHPTLQDFNFTNFFRSLDRNSQKAKLRCFFKYFDWLETLENLDNETIKISRKVMNGKQWLTIEDWTECILPLCSIDIKHQGRIENTLSDTVQNTFATGRIGHRTLLNGNSQECMQMFQIPETLIILLYMESLEDNEAIFIENTYQIGRCIDPKNKAILELLPEPHKISLCCIDAENYSALPIDQFEEDNVLRELNKCLLGFRQNTTCKVLENREKKFFKDNTSTAAVGGIIGGGRLSPIGESGSNSPRDVSTTIIIKQPSTATLQSSTESYKMENDIDRRRSWLTPKPNNNNNKSGDSRGSIVSGPTASGRRGRFIVLGSSGELLPVNRKPLIQNNSSSSLYSSCDSDGEEFHSAKGSFDDDDQSSEDEGYSKELSKELDTPEKRETFVKKLKQALRQSSNYTDSTASSYAVGISISGSQDCDEAIRLRRGGSTGFVLTEDSLDEDFYKESLEQEKQWLNKFRTKQQGILQKKDSNDSSKYSFSTEYSSELEEVYEQFSKWLDDPIIKDESKELDPRDEAVLKFANSLLKRTLSETFVGVPLTDGCVSSTVGMSAEEASIQEFKQKKNKPILSVRSLSLELAKHKHRLAAQLRNEDEIKFNGHHKSPITSEQDDGNIQQPDDKIEELQRIVRVPPIKPPRKKKNSNSKRFLSWSVSFSQSLYSDDVTLKIAQLGQRYVGHNRNLRAIATGNWGCGSTQMGDVQLKLVIQWMAASVAGVPFLVYYTNGDNKLAKSDTVIRVLRDRKWTVGELALATLQHSKDMLDNLEHTTKKDVTQSFFEKLIGI